VINAKLLDRDNYFRFWLKQWKIYSESWSDGKPTVLRSR